MNKNAIYAASGVAICLLALNLPAQSKPNDAEAHYKQAAAFIQKDDDKNAIAEASQAIKLKPSYWEAYSIRGIAYTRLGEFEKAIADLTEVIRLNPKDPNGYKNRAMAYGRKGDRDKALADQEMANKLPAK